MIRLTEMIKKPADVKDWVPYARSEIGKVLEDLERLQFRGSQMKDKTIIKEVEKAGMIILNLEKYIDRTYRRK